MCSQDYLCFGLQILITAIFSAVFSAILVPAVLANKNLSQHPSTLYHFHVNEERTESEEVEELGEVKIEGPSIHANISS